MLNIIHSFSTKKYIMEEYRFIEGYEVSNYGNCKQNIGIHQNYYRTTDGSNKLIHILVAKAFPEICGEWFEGCVVHHKNYDTKDNRAENLMVCSRKEHFEIHRKENIKKRQIKNPNNEMWYRIAEKKKANNTLHNTNKWNNIGKFDKNNNLLQEYATVYDAVMDNEGLNAKVVRRCLNGVVKTAGGFIWKKL